MKILIDPLLFIELILLILSIVLIVETKRRRKYVSAGILFTTILLTILSLPVTSQLLSSSLTVNTALNPHDKLDAIVVLGSGYYQGSNPGKDYLGGETVLRVVGGVNVADSLDAQWFIFSADERQVELMKRFAMRMGYPSERIILETQSNNTREHALFVAKLGLLDSNCTIGIVTSPYHLRRSIAEFQGYFKTVVPLPAYTAENNVELDLTMWIPGSSSLGKTTMIIQEHIGFVWYRIIHFFGF